MAIVPSTTEQLLQTQELLQAELRHPQAKAANVNLTADMDASLVLDYRGRWFRVPPLDWRLGIRMQEVAFELEALSKLEENLPNLRRLEELHEAVIPLFRAAVQPVNVILKLFWRWSENPFEHASMTEVSQLLSFFSMCRTRSHVRPMSSSILSKSLSSWTPQTISRSSSASSPTGS